MLLKGSLMSPPLQACHLDWAVVRSKDKETSLLTFIKLDMANLIPLIHRKGSELNAKFLLFFGTLQNIETHQNKFSNL